VGFLDGGARRHKKAASACAGRNKLGRKITALFDGTTDIASQRDQEFPMDIKRTTLADELQAICRAARKAGADFPTIWQDRLKRHPMVVDIPTHLVRAGRPILSVPMLGGGHLLFDDEEVRLD